MVGTAAGTGDIVVGVGVVAVAPSARNLVGAGSG